ncbi:glycosyltransferase family 2 protein [Myxococcota bacterium]
MKRNPTDSETEAPQLELSVVIPAYNEAENLHPLHTELKAVLDGLALSFEIVFVDDGSTDNSPAILEELHAAHTHVKVVQFRRNFGQTAAFAAGFDYAQGALIVTLDADGQNDPADIPRLLEKMKEGDYDFVTGRRVNRQEALLRRLLSRTANWIISRSTKISIQDRGCSLKLFRGELVKHLRLYGQLHRFLPELVSAIGVRVAEVPIRDRARRAGQSKYGAISRTPRVVLDLVTVSFLLGFFASPMRLFGSVALVTTLLGFLLGGQLAATKAYYAFTGGWTAFHSYEIGSRPLFLVSIFLVTLGVQFLMMGLLGEMIMRAYYEARNRPTYFVRRVLD